MSRRSRRGGRVRGRRTAGRASRRGFSLPLPVIGVVVVGVVVALIAFLVLQAGGSSTDEFAAAARIEADDDPNLPGEWVNLPEIYGAPYPETADHVRRLVDFAADGNTNPPVGGPHCSVACGDDPTVAPPFCGPAPWGVFREPWEPATLVHNMEHGGVVLWYNTSDQALIAELEELIGDRLKDNVLLVMTPYPDMEEEYIALTAWSRIDKFPVAEFTEERVNEFIDVYDRRFNPERF